METYFFPIRNRKKWKIYIYNIINLFSKNWLGIESGVDYALNFYGEGQEIKGMLGMKLKKINYYFLRFHMGVRKKKCLQYKV